MIPALANRSKTDRPVQCPHCNYRRVDLFMASHQTVIVTGGAGGGIGHGISTVMARAGWHVLIADVDDQAADQLHQALAGEQLSVKALTVDLTDDDAPKRVIDAAVSWTGAVHGLVNNAGRPLCETATDISDDQFDAVMALNLRAIFRLSREALGQLQKTGGSIVNIASVHARATMTTFSVYAASKAAVEGLTRGLAVDFGPHGVRANCVLPGLVDGPQSRRILAELVDDVEAFMDDWLKTSQLLPYATMPQDVGKLVAFLLSDDARAITGQSVAIDAGTLTQLVNRGE